MHHVALSVSDATFRQVVERLDERGIGHSGVKDRGFMDSIYFTDPLGLLIELASYRFEPPSGQTHAAVLLEAHRLRVERGDHHIEPVHVADAIERLVARTQDSLSEDRGPRDPIAERPLTANHHHGAFRRACGAGRLDPPAPVAQWIERSPPEREVAGSNPAGRAA